MRVLVVGCGYVGLALGARLVKEGHEVWGLRRGHAADAQLSANGISPVEADISDPMSLTGLPSKYDWVVHCVSASGGGTEEYRRVYLEGTRHVLAWLASAPPQRLVYTSSTSVYGQTDGSLVYETSTTAPEAKTAKILVETENLLLEAFRQYGFPVNILRVAGIYGPDRGYWLRQFLRNEAKIEGNGTRLLNMIHRDDLVSAILAVLRSGRPGEIYNAVDDEPVSQLACFQWLAKKLGKGLPPKIAQDFEAERKRGVTDKQVSNRKLRVELGCSLQYPTFREGYSAELQRLGHIAC